MNERSDWFGRFVAQVEAAFTIPRGKGRLVRPRHPRMIAGVCSGVAEHFGWNVGILRVLVVVFSIGSSGLLVLAYAAAWVLIPEGTFALPGGSNP